MKLHQFWKRLIHISSNMISAPFSASSSSETPIAHILDLSASSRRTPMHLAAFSILFMSLSQLRVFILPSYTSINFVPLSLIVVNLYAEYLISITAFFSSKFPFDTL